MSDIVTNILGKNGLWIPKSIRQLGICKNLWIIVIEPTRSVLPMSLNFVGTENIG